ncbi:hypothetical protein FB446DRAFT_848954 [Lentinula raphanica]|nr:hypothetical protein FB446DRAFT_848954 [Lentinula raphanica]
MSAAHARKLRSLQSPYSSFFKTNHAASPSERTELEALILEAQQEISEIDSEIPRVRAVLDGLRARRSEVQEFVDVHRALMAPIRRVPVEMMAMIFVYCLPLDRYPIRSLFEAPLLLTVVCREWREIVITYPPLWNALHIHIAPRIAFNTEELTLRQQGVCGWIARAGALPLSLSLSFDEFGDEHEPEDISQGPLLDFVKSLMYFGPRLEAFHLNVGKEIYPLLESVSPQTFPILKRISLTLDGIDVDSLPGIPFVSRIPDMLLLSALSIRGFYPDQYSRSAFVGTNLTELDLGDGLLSICAFPLQELLSILRETPRLQKCCVNVSYPFAHAYETVNMMSLRSLSICFEEDDDTSDLIEVTFRSLNCPALEALSVNSYQSEFEHDVLHHRFTFTQLYGSLQHLRVEFPMTSGSLIRCLELAPNLTVLEIVDCEYSVKRQSFPLDSSSYHYLVEDNVLQRLAYEPSSPVLCPRLETFRLFVYQFYGLRQTRKSQLVSISTPALLDFLESRRAVDDQITNIKECDILMPPERRIYPGSISERLTQLMQDGMRLRVVQSECQYPSHRLEDDPERKAVYHSSNILPSFDTYFFREIGSCAQGKDILVDNVSDSWT